MKRYIVMVTLDGEAQKSVESNNLRRAQAAMSRVASRLAELAELPRKRYQVVAYELVSVVQRS